MNAELQQVVDALKTDLLAAIKGEVLPMVASAAKAAVAAEAASLGPAGIAVELAGPPIIDAVDSYIMSLLGHAVPANAQPAPTDTESRLSAVEKHVASLTVATGMATSTALAEGKAAAAPVAMPQVEGTGA